MKKKLLFAASLCCALVLVSCSDDKGGGEKPRAGRIAFDAPALAAHLNADFETFCLENEKYAVKGSSAATGKFAMNGYLKAEGDSILLRIAVGKDDYGRIGSVEAVLEDRKNDLTAWEYYITHSEELNLGRFLGTKFKSPSTSGVHQTVDETIALVETGGTTGTKTCTIFGVVPGSAYAVAMLEEGAFSVILTNNYLTLDYPAMRTWLGGDHAAFTDKYYILGNKINMFGNIYVYFDAARDKKGNQFTVNVNADKDGAKISQIDVYVSSDAYTPEEQLAVWKEYAANAAEYGLGTFKEAYTTDSFGDKKSDFASLAEAMAHVEANGRPDAFSGGIILVFEADGIGTSLVMNAQFIYLLMKDPNYNVE